MRRGDHAATAITIVLAYSVLTELPALSISAHFTLHGVGRSRWDQFEDAIVAECSGTALALELCSLWTFPAVIN